MKKRFFKTKRRLEKENLKKDNKSTVSYTKGGLTVNDEDLDYMGYVIERVNILIPHVTEQLSTKGDTIESKNLISALNYQKSKDYLKEWKLHNKEYCNPKIIAEIECSQEYLNKIVEQFLIDYKILNDVSSNDVMDSFWNCSNLTMCMLMLICSLRHYYKDKGLIQTYEILLNYVFQLEHAFTELRYVIDNVMRYNV